MFVWQGDPQWHYNVANAPVFDPLTSVLFVRVYRRVVADCAACPTRLPYLAVRHVDSRHAQRAGPALHAHRRGTSCRLHDGRHRQHWSDRVGRAPQSSVAWIVGGAFIIIWLGAAVVKLSQLLCGVARQQRVRFYHQANVNEMARVLKISPGHAGGGVQSVFE